MDYECIMGLKKYIKKYDYPVLCVKSKGKDS